ncbi:helix-turn-helix domain-containing protein [Streptosporangium canum]|uniref:helix-turn-helix transcriptional regulator n=1 Tax=Streptosporangium canum TaxID=324952 RepID=UPI00343F76C1
MPTTPHATAIPRDATMTPEELMELVGIADRSTLWHWNRKGIGPTKYAIDRRTTRYSRSEVRAWLLAGAKRTPRDQATASKASAKGGDAHAG